MTMLPHLDGNLETLNNYAPALVNWLRAQPLDDARLREAAEARIFSNKWGLLDLHLPEGKGMFESMPPAPLYRDWIPQDKAATGATLVVGCNLGYGVNHLCTNTPLSHKIMVLEPDPVQLYCCLGQTDYRPAFEAKKLHFLPPSEEHLATVVQNLDLQFIYGRIYLRQDLPSSQISALYSIWSKKAQARLENFSVELNTLKFRQDLMVGNELKNFRRAMDEGSLTPLRGVAEGLSAVILGAGPSLAQFAPQLARNPGNALYATSLQTLPALQALDLKPHFCLALDFNDHMMNIYKRLDMQAARDVPLIYSTKVDPRVIETYPGPTLPLWTMGGMATFVLKDNELVLDAGGNVSLTLIRLLRWSGVARITLVGQDFAWKDAGSHAEGHHARRNIVFNEKQHNRITNLEGEEIFTSRQYLAAKRDLEDDIRQTPFDISYLYGGYAPILGARPLSLDEARMDGALASAPGSLQRFLERLSLCRSYHRHFQFEPQSNSWTSNLHRAEKRLEKLFRRVGRNQHEIHGLMEQVSLFIHQDPLYLPYLYNETLDLAGLTKAKFRYEPRDLGEFRRIVRNVLKKVKEVDRRLTGTESRRDAA
ncbi:MAG: motility associated factor glycosyltransferase family protein [Desulfovibrio sp.]